jgi:glucose/arabinose dehydrogenase
MSRLLGAVVLVLTGALVSACGDDDDDDGGGSSMGGTTSRGGTSRGGTVASGGTSAGGAAAGASAAGAGGEQTARLVELIATEYHFNPSVVHAEPGEKLIISLRNLGATAHSIELELPSGEVELEGTAAPEETAQLEITAPTVADSYTFYCPVANHRELGMEGTLVVREPAAVALEPVAEGLTSPVAMTPAADDSGRLFVVDQVGLIRVIDGGELVDEPFLDLSAQLVELETAYDERGLLGLAFHPGFAENGRFFVYYSGPLREEGPAGWDHTNYLSELTVSSSNANSADPASERVILSIDQPQANHNGGGLAFGPDGFLYLALGDGGGAGDVDTGHTPDLGNGQDTSNLLGSILRIDVDTTGNVLYAVPPDNPFVGTGVGEEIFAYGFRNPYRFSFDMGGDEALYVGDAGQNRWEEVSRVTLGGNYGWNILEGTHCFNAEDFDSPLATCANTGQGAEDLLWPVIELANTGQEGGLGTAVVGGYVYRGSDLPAELRGRYVFGVFSSGQDSTQSQLFVAGDEDGTGDDLWPIERVAPVDSMDGSLPYFLKGFGQDEAGEIYVLVTSEAGPSGESGQVLKLAAAP